MLPKPISSNTEDRRGNSFRQDNKRSLLKNPKFEYIISANDFLCFDIVRRTNVSIDLIDLKVKVSVTD